MKPLVVLSTALSLAAVFPAGAASLLPEKGRAILEAHQESILPFSSSLSVSASAGGRSMSAREQVVRGIATVLTDDGLMVTALSSLNPSSMLSGQKINTPQGKVDLNISVEIKELKILTPDGLEIPASLVMKDTDLDLAFFRPKPGNDDVKDVKFHPVDLKDSGPGQVLDEVLLLNRLGKTFSYQTSTGTSEIISKIEKPRLLYRVAGATAGAPVYTAEGKILGIAANRKPIGEDSGDGNAMRGLDMLVILPAAEVAKIADQARIAKPQDEEPAEKTAEKDAKPAAKEDKAAEKAPATEAKAPQREEK